MSALRQREPPSRAHRPGQEPASGSHRDPQASVRALGDGASRAPRLRVRCRLSSGLCVVLYHHLAARTGDLEGPLHVATPPDLFEAHIARLARSYEVVDLDTVLSGRLPRRALLITFDDGYRSVLDVGLPILARHGLPSVFFVSGAYLDASSMPFDNLLCFLASRFGLPALVTAALGDCSVATVEELVDITTRLPYARRRRLEHELPERFGVDGARLRADSGLFLDPGHLPQLADFGCELANHTRSHVRCRSIDSEEAAMLELVEHRRDLERAAAFPVRAFSYPYGSHVDATPFAERILASSGHEATFLVDSRSNPRGGRRVPWNRVSLHHQPASRLALELELLPRLRGARDLLGRRS